MKSKTDPAILIVNDDPKIINKFKLMLSKENFRIHKARTCEEGIKIINENPIEVALVDFQKGNEDALTCAKLMKNEDDSLEIIIFTRFPNYVKAVDAIKSGIFDYISTDSSEEKVLETIKNSLLVRKRRIHTKAKSTGALDSPIKFILLCNHTFVKDSLKGFSNSQPNLKLIRSFDSIEEFKNCKFFPQIHFAFICADCCFESFNDTSPFLYDYYKILPNVTPIFINENYSSDEKIHLIKSGVKGFLPIDLKIEELEIILPSIIEKGEIWAPRRLISLALSSGFDYICSRLANKKNSYGLSKREQEILKIASLGLKNREIANRLFISELTVKGHIHQILKKLGVDNRAKAIHLANEKKIF